MGLKITNLRLQSYLPVATELNQVVVTQEI